MDETAEESPIKKSLTAARKNESSFLEFKVGAKRQLTNTSMLLPEQNLFKQNSSFSVIDSVNSSA